MFRRFSSGRELVAVLIGFFLLYAVFTWPLVTDIGHQIAGQSGDAVGSIYDLWVLKHFRETPISTFNNNLIGYPGGTIVHGTASISAVLVQAPALLISWLANEVVAFNAVAALGFVGAPVSMYWLLRSRGKRISVAVYGACGFLFFPFHMFSFMAWPSLAQTAWLPIAQIAIDRLGDDRKKFRWITPMLVTMLAFLTNGYIGLMTAVLTTVGYIVYFIRHSNSIESSLAAKINIRVVLVGTLLFFSSALAAFKLIEVIRHEVTRSSIELFIYGLRLSDLLLPAEHSLLRGHMPNIFGARILHGSNPVETSQFLGYGTMSLALFWVVRSFKSKQYSASAPEVLLIFFGLWIGMSQQIKVFGITFPSPSRFIFMLAPFWRAYSRFGVLIMFAAILLACSALEYILSQQSRKFGNLFLGASFILLLVELPVRLPNQVMKFEAPKYVAFLQKQTGAIVNYPLAQSSDGLVYERRFWQRLHGRPMVNGYQEMDQNLISNGIGDVFAPHISAKLKGLQARWVVVDRSLYPTTTKFQVVQDDFLKLRQRFGSLEIYENISPSAEPISYFQNGVYAKEYAPNGSSYNWMMSTAQVQVISLPGQCVQFDLDAEPFEGMGAVNIWNRSSMLTRTTRGNLRAKFVNVTGHDVLRLSSQKGAVQVPGPDPRSISFMLSGLKVSSSTGC